MALYDASGNQLNLTQIRQILSQYSSGEENPTRIFDANGESLGNGAGAPARTALNNELSSFGYDGGGFRGSNGEFYMPLDDPNKLAQAQQLGVVQYIGGVPMANFNDQNLRGGIGSGALFDDMPQTGFVGDILTNPAFLVALGAGAGFGSGLFGAGTEAGAAAGTGGGSALVSGTGPAVNGGLLDYSMTGTLGGGYGTAAAGGAADAALASGAAPLASSVGEYSLASGVGGGLGGGATLGAGGAGLYSLGSGLTNGLGNTAGSAAASAGATALGPNSSVGNTTFGIPNNVLGGLATGVGGLLAANETGDAYRDVANQYLALGQPYRDKLNASYQPGFSLSQADPAFQNALDVAGQTSARALSTKYGNPADSPTAQAEMQKYLLGNVELPQLNTYRSQLGSFGNLGVNTAGTGSLAGANTTGQGYEAIGAGLGQALNPQPSLTDLFKQFGMGANSNKTSLSIGGLPYGSK